MTTYSCGPTTTMPHSKRMLHRYVALPVLAVALLVVGACAGAGTVTTAPPHPTAVPSPTASAPALTGVAPSASALVACGGSAGAPLSLGQVQVGTFDAWQVLPATLPLKPLPTSVAKVTGNVALSHITVDVGLNPSSATSPSYLCAVTARIVAFHPLAASIPNVTRSCSDHAYQDPGGADYGGDCGTELGPPATATIHFPDSTPGTTVTVPVLSSAGPGKPAAFPSPDGRAPRVGVVLSVPASGDYTFVIGLWQGRNGPVRTLQVVETFNLQAMREWSGQFCTSDAMQAQLPPPTNPPTQLLCPGAPPPLT